MPFGIFKRDKSADNRMGDKEKKNQLGMKVVLAQQNPEPVYDLSDCGVVELPPDTFVMCRLLQKTSLLLNNNAMSNLEKGGKLAELSSIQVLDLSENKISNIPDSINKLSNLRILKLSGNKLKSLPSSISECVKLEELELASNKFSKVPTSVCALPKLRLLSLCDNRFTSLPVELCRLQNTLHTLNIDEDKIVYPSVASEGVEAIMKSLCEASGVEYVGLIEQPGEDDQPIPSCAPHTPQQFVPEDQNTLEYMRRKEEQLRRQLSEMQEREKEQLENFMKEASSNKKFLLDELSQDAPDIVEYEKKRSLMLSAQLKIEETMREEEAGQLQAYLTGSSNKEALLNELTAQNNDLDMEVEALVAIRECVRKKLVNDLSQSEQETDLAIKELLDNSDSHRIEDYMTLLSEQDEQMQCLLCGVAEASAELRKEDIVKSMQEALIQAAEAEAHRIAVEKEQEAKVNAILANANLVDEHLEGVMNAKMVDKELWVETLMEDEIVQAAAFRLLLLDMDLKRNNILRQISQVEYELARLSWLEVRKRKHSVQYGSTTMLEQRSTLAGLLRSLLKQKDDRESELTDWFTQVKEMQPDEEDAQDFWLIQYQRLLSMKPSGLAEAEQKLDPEVLAILQIANALELAPVFARHEINKQRLLDMTIEEAEELGIGGATYQSLQRALQKQILGAKLGEGPSVPSAPPEEDLPSAPSLQEFEDSSNPSAPPAEGQFIEAECVVCLTNLCDVVFLPCGHVCTCSNCCAPLALCPMCRSEVTNKIALAWH
ncbi:unnamed protein product, partial [Meganyctiphanes norvegica]